MLEGIKFYFTVVFDYVQILQLIALSAAIVITMGDIKFHKIKSVLYTMAMLVCLFILFTITMALTFGVMGAAKNPFVSTFAHVIAYIFVFVFYAVFFCKYNRIVKIVVCISTLATTVIVFELGAVIGYYIAKQMNIDGGVFRFIAMIFTIIFAVLMRRFHVKKYDDLPMAGVILIIVINSLCIIISRYPNVHPGIFGEFPVYMISMNFCLYIMTVAVYFLLYFISKERADVVQLRAEKELMKVNVEMIELSEKNISDIKQIRHDIKNQYAYINMMCEENQYDELKNYIKNMGINIANTISYVDCGNRIISAILNIKTAKASAQNIVIKNKLSVPKILPFSDMDMCSILSNLLDNAIEACVRYQLKKPTINIEINLRHDYLYIGVVNPLPKGIDKEALLKLNTSKKDFHAHGLGTQIVKRLVKKYSGYVNYSIENNIFIAEVALDLGKRGETNEKFFNSNM